MTHMITDYVSEILLCLADVRRTLFSFTVDKLSLLYKKKVRDKNNGK